MAGESQKDPMTGQADPSVLTTENLQREVKVLRDETDFKVTALRDVFAEKFKSIEGQLATAERWRLEQKDDTKQAVDAAFEAAKEGISSVTTSHNDLKDRVGAIENVKLGAGENRASLYAALAGVLSSLALVVSVAILLTR